MRKDKDGKKEVTAKNKVATKKAMAKKDAYLKLVKKIRDNLVITNTVKNIGYYPMSLGEYNDLRGWDMPRDEDPKREGFLVAYEASEDNPPNVDGFDNYISWSPKEPLIKAMKAYDETLGTAKSKTLDATKGADLSPDVKVHGNPDLWVCINKASNDEEGWMKSTKVMQLGNGCLVQVSTQQGDNVAEAVTFVPGAKLRKVNGNYIFS